MKNFKKVMAATLAATMVLGSTSMVFASDTTTNSLEGQGEVDGLVNLDVVSVEVPTDRSDIFNFTLDPQGLIQKSIAANKSDSENALKDGITEAAYPAAKASTMYFANQKSAGTPAQEAKAAKAESSNTELEIEVVDADITAGSYVYKSAEDKYWKKTEPNSATEEALTAGWYASDTNFGEDDNSKALDDAPTPVNFAGKLTITGDPASGDTLTVTAKTAAEDAVPATYEHSGTSDALVATNKGFVDVNISVDLKVSDLGDKVKMSSDKDGLATATTPLIYLEIQGGETPKKQAIYSNRVETILFDELAKNSFDDFNVSYDATKKTYNVVKNAKDFKTYEFKLSGATSTKGWTTDLATIKPKAKVVWSFTKKDTSGATLTLGTDGKASFANLKKDANFTKITFYGENYVNVSTPGDNKITYDLKDADGKTTWTKEDGGSFSIALPADYVEFWQGQKVTAFATLSDGSTMTATASIPAASND